MTSMLEYLRKLFQKSEKTPNSPPFLHDTFDPEELAVRGNKSILLQHENVLISPLHHAINRYHLKSNMDDHQFQFFNHPGTNGLNVAAQVFSDMKRRDWKLLMYHWYHKILEIGYTLNLADVRSQSSGASIVKTMRIYLKPSIKSRVINNIDNQSKAVQLYGNIHLEYIEKNDIPVQLRLLAHYYNDRNFTPAQPFGDLLEVLKFN